MAVIVFYFLSEESLHIESVVNIAMGWQEAGQAAHAVFSLPPSSNFHFGRKK